MDLRESFNNTKNKLGSPNYLSNNSTCIIPLYNIDNQDSKVQSQLGPAELKQTTLAAGLVKDKVMNENRKIQPKLKATIKTSNGTSMDLINDGVKNQSEPEPPMAEFNNVSNNENSIKIDTDIQITLQNNASTNNVETFPSRRKTAILVEHGYKNYGSQSILNDFNMNVEENTIYGLLGSSGCGKTTLLSCIVSLRKLDSGKIWINGKPTGTKESGIPGKKIGYMPQEIALNGEFNVVEVLQYFGRIYGMSQPGIKARHKYLIKLLSLEKCKGFIRDLSDGQKRRVSLAVALLHQPDILILDEPTVGCDPLLRQSIWNFLTELVTQGRVTVIVTTHYIEETRQADRVGIIRNGRLLVEDSPNQLLLEYNASLLDDIVLTLCQKDKINDDDDADSMTLQQQQHQKQLGFKLSTFLPNFITNRTNDSKGNYSTSENPKQMENNYCTKHVFLSQSKLEENYNDDDEQIQTKVSNRLRALVIKNVIVLLRNLSFLLFSLILPAVTVIVFCLCVGSDAIGLRVGIINNEMMMMVNYQNRSQFNNFNDSSRVICPVNDPLTCLGVNLSCLYLDSLNKKQIELIPFNNIQDAIQQVQQRNLYGYILFESEFSKHIFPRLLIGKRNNETIYGSTIRIKLDMANKGVGQTIKKLLFDGFRLFTTRLLESCSIDPIGRDLPLIFETPIYGTDDNISTDFLASGVSLGFVFFMATLTCGLTYIIEKKDGMINRVLVTGVSTIEIMTSHLIVQFVIVIVQAGIVFFILLYVFNITCEGSIALAFCIMLLSCITGMSLGFLAATFCNEEKNAMLAAMGSIFPSFLLTGILWPIESVPTILRYVGFLIPTTLTTGAFRSVLLRGFGFSHHVILHAIISTVGWAIVYWMIILCWNRFSKRS